MAFIGTKPHEVPSNAMLGKLAYLDGDGGIVYVPITAATTINGSDKCRLFDVASGTFTVSFISAANLPIDWKVYVRNSGTGTITLDPAGAETIDGVSTLSLFSGETRLIYSTGTSLRSVLLDGDGVLNITEDQPSGTSSATLTNAAWNTRTLNTVKTNRISGSSLSTNTITLPAGTYSISGAAKGVAATVATYVKLRLYNNTAAAVAVEGLTSLVGTDRTGDIPISGVFTLSTQSVLVLQQYSTASSVLAQAASIPSTAEQYTNITIRKIA